MRKCFKYQYVMIILSVVTLTAGFLVNPAQAADCDSGTGVLYKDAIPCFVNTIVDKTRSALSSKQIRESGDWIVSTMNRFGEFLGDLRGITRDVENDSSSAFIQTSFQDFVDKWKKVPESFPHIDVLSSEIKPVIDGLFDDLPKPDLNSAPASTSPNADTYAFYQKAEAANPWGLGSFFRIEPLPSEVVSRNVSSVEETKTVSGNESTFVNQSNADITRNDVNVFSEEIKDNELKYRVDNSQVPTLLEEYNEGLNQQADDLGIFDRLKTLTQETKDNTTQDIIPNQAFDNCDTVSIYRRDQLSHRKSCR